jgi:hypothetical protein
VGALGPAVALAAGAAGLALARRSQVAATPRG